MEPMMDSSHLFHSGPPLSLFLVRKEPEKGSPLLTRSVSHTLCSQHWLIPNAFNLDLN